MGETTDGAPVAGTILVLGGSGMLGRALAHDLTRRGWAFEAPGRERLDVSAPGLADRVVAQAPSAVINAMAFTDVGAAERPENREQVDLLNRDAPAELADACRRLDVPLVHVSTDYVFDGAADRPYPETAPTAPLQVYGQSKLEGEQKVLGRNPDAVVVRTSTLYGPGPRVRPHYVDAILAQARKGGPIRVVRLPVSSPTLTVDLAAGLLELLQAGARGVVHLTNRGACSRLELARETVRLSGLEVAVEVRPAPPGDLARPAYSVLDTGAFKRWTGRAPRDWRVALSEYVESTLDAAEPDQP